MSFGDKAWLEQRGEQILALTMSTSQLFTTSSEPSMWGRGARGAFPPLGRILMGAIVRQIRCKASDVVLDVDPPPLRPVAALCGSKTSDERERSQTDELRCLRR